MEQELKSPSNKSVTWGHLGHFSSHECEDKVKHWCDEIERPSKFAKFEPHAVYAYIRETA